MSVEPTPMRPLEAEQIGRDIGTSDESRLGVVMTMLSTLVRLPEPFPEVLHQVALLAARAVSGADGAWLTWSPVGQAPAAAASRDGLLRLDQCQYLLDQGPSLEAYETQRVVCAPDLGADLRWPRFAGHAATERVRGILAVPLTEQGTSLGVLSVCSRAPRALAHDSEAHAGLFAEHVGHTLANAQALVSAETRSTQLEEALATRAVIEQAKGIVMGKEGCSATEAFDRLRVASQNGHIKLRTVAQLLVDSVASAPGPAERIARPVPQRAR